LLSTNRKRGGGGAVELIPSKRADNIRLQVDCLLSPVDPALHHRYVRERWGWGSPRAARKGLMTSAATF